MAESIRATQIDMTVSGLVLPNGLRIHSVTLLLPSPIVRTSPWTLPEGTQVDANVVVKCSDLEDHLSERRPAGLSEFRISAEAGRLQVVARMRTIVAVEVGAVGTLEFRQGHVDFVVERAEVAGLEAPRKVIDEIMLKVNPLIDLTGWPVDIHVRELTSGDGELRWDVRLRSTAPVPRREP